MSKVMRRCQGCEHEKIIVAQDGHKFAGCTKEPYKDQFVGDIKNCPMRKPL